MLKASGLNFRGNVEGHDLFENPVEVVVCEGFVGNVVLKSCEALVHAIFSWLKHELKKNPVRIAGAVLARGAFKAIGKKTNADEYGGSLLLGRGWHLRHRARVQFADGHQKRHPRRVEGH